MRQRGPDGGSPPERATSDSWPALHGRPVLRRTVAIGLVVFVSVLAALAVRGVNALTVGRGAIETDRDRAELLAGLHPSQHPGAGRYYVPVGAVYTRGADGLPVAYLHYRLAGGREVGVGDFLRTYDLPAPGAVAPLPADLTEALGGDEPDSAPEVGAPYPAASPSPSPSVSPSVLPSALPEEAPSASPSALPDEAPTASPSALPDEAPTGDPAPDADPADTAQPVTEAADPEPREHIAPAADPSLSPTPTPDDTEDPAPGTDPTRTRARRIYVAPDPAGLPGAADIYVRATG
ncbi:hypothetical protein [Kitasatospora purpeofusca]|uniref:hypothetical protein n=1 Tax=Kitasatospora purpeofusca TaxID=67352 RepID=UPI002A59ABE6|nr:hypothetical protein [Kitasatospora purpeofusca]MDY0811750.1 hypothetical protein [Kitasatospora purpeofusca]